MSKTNRLNEKARAERLAHDLDYRLQNQAYTEQTAPEDRPLLVLAEELSGQNPLGATNMERTQLRKTFEQAQASKTRPWKPLPFFRFLKPTAQLTLWAVLLVGVFAITMVLVSNLVGKPSHPISGPAKTAPATIATFQSTTETPPAPQPVSVNLEQALALVQYPTWQTVFFEYRVVWHGADGKDYSLYKQVWMDRKGQGRVLSSDQAPGVNSLPSDAQPAMYFLSDGSSLKALQLPGGQEEMEYANASWTVSPLENAGEGMRAFFPTLDGMGAVGSLSLIEFETEVAGRPALLLHGSEYDYVFDRDTGLLLSRLHIADMREIIVRAVVYDVELPDAWKDASVLSQVRFLDALPDKAAQNLPELLSSFTRQSQTVNGITIELRDLVIIGASPRATLCYPAPGEGSWRLEGVTVQAGSRPSTFYPSSSAQPQPGEDGLICETFTAAYPITTGTGAREWKLTVQRLVGPRQTTPVCEEVAKQIINDHPGLMIECRPSTGMPSYTFGKPPPGMQLYEASQLILMYFEADVRSGPWTFTINPREVTFLQYTTSPTNLVVVPAACDTMSSALSDPQFTQALDHLTQPAGVVGGGTLRSNNFTLLMGLSCDPNFSRLKPYGDERSFINGLGVLFAIRYDGQPTGDGVFYYSGVWPFVMHQGGGGSLGRGEFFVEYKGLLLPETVQPDLSQSDVRLRYLARVRLPDGSIDGAALVFTLQRAFEGYRPVDVTVEPLKDEEKQNAELTTTPAGPLPFPTLAAPQKSVSVETQATQLPGDSNTGDLPQPFDPTGNNPMSPVERFLLNDLELQLAIPLPDHPQQVTLYRRQPETLTEAGANALFQQLGIDGPVSSRTAEAGNAIFTASGQGYTMNIDSDSPPFFVLGRSDPMIETGKQPFEDRKQLAETYLQAHHLPEFSYRIEPVYGPYGRNNVIAVAQLIGDTPLYQGQSPWIWMAFDDQGQLRNMVFQELQLVPDGQVTLRPVQAVWADLQAHLMEGRAMLRILSNEEWQGDPAAQKASIDHAELVYFAVNTGGMWVGSIPADSPLRVVQPVWRFTGKLNDGTPFEILAEATTSKLGETRQPAESAAESL